MGRAERRRAERRERIESKKGKISLSKADVKKIKRDISETVSIYSVEALMTCFALAEHRLYGFGSKRILRSLGYIDGLMGAIIDDEATIEEYKRELEEEAGVAIKYEK